MKVVNHETADAFLDRAGPWLVKAEAENHIVFGIADVLRDDLNRYGPRNPFLLTVEDHAEVVGAALRTPPHKLLLTRMPAPALEALAVFFSKADPDLPAVSGPVDEGRIFANFWADKTGATVRPGMSVRAHVCEKVIHPNYSEGRLRTVEPEDAELALSWRKSFEVQAHLTEKVITTLDSISVEIATRTFHFWDHDGPKSMARHVGDTPNGVRIGLVYTPEDHRRKGYASSCVAALTQKLLDRGKKAIFLYTDLANPTSNKIYAAIGYRSVLDGMDYWFD
ncbi:MAG: GNAT family N-acetyltransferase [Planctomycetota bacterium]|jgi:predicted GNAT family acetyltransferase